MAKQIRSKKSPNNLILTARQEARLALLHQYESLKPGLEPGVAERQHRLDPTVPSLLQAGGAGAAPSLAQERGPGMRASKRNANLRRYRNLPTDAVLALLAESRDEEYFMVCRSLRRRQP